MITGASSGIGLAGAMRIIDEGGEVMLTGRHQQKLASLRTLLPERAWLLQNDGAKPEAAHALAESVESFGMLDGLWLNAGQLAFSTVENTTEMQFDTIMANNVRSQYVVDGGLLRL
ncbi:SDR family NAD(P)-dependent oxidoreductase [Klebsiella variicola subsp. variicola]|nr:SDR family NAD(P)-dependent oxidoreductase [Klebsiella variicola subsp. variicola]